MATLAERLALLATRLGAEIKDVRADKADTGHTHSRLIIALTDASTVTVDAQSSPNALLRLTLGGNRTIANPSNLVDGGTYLFEVLQDGTGNRVPTWASKYVFGTDIPAAALTTTANRKDFLVFVYNSTADKLYCTGVTRGFA